MRVLTIAFCILLQASGADGLPAQPDSVLALRGDGRSCLVAPYQGPVFMQLDVQPLVPSVGWRTGVGALNAAQQHEIPFRRTGSDVPWEKLAIPSGRITNLPTDADLPGVLSFHPTFAGGSYASMVILADGSIANLGTQEVLRSFDGSPASIMQVGLRYALLKPGPYEISVSISHLPPISREITLVPGHNYIEIAVPPLGKLHVISAGGGFGSDSTYTVRGQKWSRSLGGARGAGPVKDSVDMGYLEPGTYTLRFYSPSTGWDLKQVEIAANHTAFEELQFRPGGSISGRWPGEPLQETFQNGVQAENENFGFISTSVPPSGEFQFTNVPPGDWKVTVTLDKSGPAFEGTANVAVGQASRVQLKPVPAED